MVVGRSASIALTPTPFINKTFSLESIIFPPPVYKYKHMVYKIIILPMASRVWNLVSRPKGRTQIEGVWEQGAEENIWS
jgi:hypothetical protein